MRGNKSAPKWDAFASVERADKGGHTFEGHSDTTVVLGAYVCWGPDCVERFNGIFAFAVWKASKQCLFRTRDRIGAKPLFYAVREGMQLFTSGPKALLAQPPIELLR